MEETCEECGKTITKRAIANVVDGRVVCTACKHKIEREKERASRPPPPPEPVYDDNAPTPRQVAYAEHLGILIPAGITKWELSDLIDQAQAARQAELIDTAIANRHHGRAPKPKTNRFPLGCVTVVVVLVALLVLLQCAGVFGHR